MTYRITPEAEGAWQLRSTVSPQPVQLSNYKRYIPSFLINGEFNSQFIAVGIKVTAYLPYIANVSASQRITSLFL